jgi:hypothetical protein
MRAAISALGNASYSQRPVKSLRLVLGNTMQPGLVKKSFSVLATDAIIISRLRSKPKPQPGEDIQYLVLP